jgi:hypothetical protein
MEAKKTGAESMLTFCPKCQIHFKCTTHNKLSVDKKLVDIHIEDFTNLIANALVNENSCNDGPKGVK